MRNRTKKFINAYTFIVICMNVLIIGCFEDKGNYEYSELNEIHIDTLASPWRVDFQEEVILTPNVVTSKESEYEYYWLLIDKQSNIACDTISREKELKYTVNLAAGSYRLVFRVKDMKTGLIASVETNLEVASNLSDGWIILKDDGNYTDLDLFTYEGHEYPNLIYSMNGESLEGTARDIGFYVRKTYDSNTQIQTSTKCLMVMSSKDIKVISANDMAILLEYEDLFYDIPVVCNPQKIYNQGLYSSVFFINNGDLYSSPGTGMFSPPYQNVYLTGDKISTHCAVSASSMNGFYMNGFNETWGNIVKWDMEGNEYVDRMGMSNLELLHMYDNGIGGVGYLFQNKNYPDSLYVFRSITMQLDTLPDNLNIVYSSCIGSNWELPYIYFTKGHELWRLDVSLRVETKVDYNFNGEEITFIAHVKTPIAVGKNKLIIATYLSGNYKVYLFDLLSGLPDGEPQVLKGEGRVTDVFHQSFYNATGDYYSYPQNY